MALDDTLAATSGGCRVIILNECLAKPLTETLMTIFISVQQPMDNARRKARLGGGETGVQGVRAMKALLGFEPDSF